MFNKELAFARNLGFISQAEQEKIHQSTVAIAGAGGDGGALALQLARLGFGTIKLADPDPFEVENLNRQAVCTNETVGVNKAQAVAEYLHKINPDIKTPLYTEGVTESNVEDFLNDADLLIDETEFTIHSLGVMLARAAREKGIPNLMALNIGFGATVTTYHPEGLSLEKSLGLSETASLSEIATAEVSLSRWLPYIPNYGDINVLKKVSDGEKSAPSIAPGVAMAASVASTQSLLNILHGQNNRKPPVYAPKTIVVDAMSLESKIIRYPRFSHYIDLGNLVLRNLLQKSPRASY